MPHLLPVTYFVSSFLPIPQLQSKSLEVTVWDFFSNSAPRFLGEVLLDMDTALLNNQTYWYDLEDHDENNGQLPLPGNRKK